MSMAAEHSANRILHDAIFEANHACQQAIAKHGAQAVTNATIGVVLGEDEKLAVLPTMEKVFRSLDIRDMVAYAPIAGLLDYLNAAVDLTFADFRPAGYISAMATAGGTGAIHHAIANYAARGDAVLTSDWFWGNYNVICVETGKRLETFTLFDDNQLFNIASFTTRIEELLKVQDSLLVIINSPAHNPTGFALTEEDWDKVIDVIKSHAANDKRISLLVDIAYIDFAGDKAVTRNFMSKFGNLPENVLVMVAFSMSKSYTLYGQRTGALIAVSSSKSVIDEFNNVSKYSSRATWSNINRGAQALLVAINSDKQIQAAYEKERNDLYQLVQHRAEIFEREAEDCGLHFLPYKGGFFISVPAANPIAICSKLHEQLLFAVPLKLGIRVAACSVSTKKMHGVAAKIKSAFDYLSE